MSEFSIDCISDRYKEHKQLEASCWFMQRGIDSRWRLTVRFGANYRGSCTGLDECGRLQYSLGFQSVLLG